MPSRPGPSPRTAAGSTTSHQGMERNRESAASRLTRWVVPDRGQPDHDDRWLELDVEGLGVAGTKSSNRSLAFSSPTRRSRTM